MSTGYPHNGHDIARRQIAKHGRDRYPTVAAQFGKLLEEAGEIAEALWGDEGGDLAPSRIREHVVKELADTGLALFELCNKLGVTDLIGAMRDLVDADERRFVGESDVHIPPGR